MNFMTINLRGIGDSLKAGWVRSIKATHGVHFIAIQETQMGDLARIRLASFWGRSRFMSDSVAASGRSGGMLCLWDPAVFGVSGVTKSRHYMIIAGVVRNFNITLHIVNVYAPQDVIEKRRLWQELSLIMAASPGFWILLGDFNSVRSRVERLNSSYNASAAHEFNDFIDECELFEYSMGGLRFTYITDQGDKLSKIDRVLVSSNFFFKWPDAALTALPREKSDHSPLVLKLVPSDFGATPFRFFNSWLEIDGFVDFVYARAAEFVYEGPMGRKLFCKLRWLKEGIKEWMGNQRRSSKAALFFFEQQLKELDLLAESRGLTEAEGRVRATIKKEVADIDRRQKLDMHQKSRIKWAIDGDENSSFFHGFISSNISSNRINGLEVGDEWVSDPSSIKSEACRFFKHKFSEPVYDRPEFMLSFNHVLPSSAAESLTAPFSILEIKAAVWECEGNKAPGPDGLNFCFIRRFWDILEPDFIDVFDQFYYTGEVNGGVTSSFIALIPKKVDPLVLSDYRPISLIGTINKVVSKVLVNRLRPYMEDLIHEEQTAYLCGRSIIDGPLVINEVLSWLRKSKRGGFLLKVDIDKAFDSVSWSFLINVMEQMGFGSVWCSWVKGLLSSARSSVLINGSPSAEFTCTRGLRQGDPLSPYLFIIAMNALSCFIKRACSVGCYHGISLPYGCTTTLSHFLYADDVIFVGQPTLSNVRNLARLLRGFFLASGLRINVDKSQIFGIELHDQEIQSLAAVFGCHTGAFPFEYLGLQVGANMNNERNWQPVVEIFKKRLSRWKGKSLSMGGKVTLIKSVLDSLPIYYFSIYRVPQNVIKKLDIIRKRFLWGDDSENRKMHWVDWDRVMLPIEKEGLGITSLRAANVGMLCKWWWRFKQENNKLWRNVIWAIHHSNRSWSFLPVRLSMTGVWKNIYKVEQDLVQVNVNISDLIVGKLGSGNQIRFWIDLWLGDKTLKSRFPSLFVLETSKGCLVQDRYYWHLCNVEWSWCWKRRLVTAREFQELAELHHLLTNVRPSLGDDTWRWDLEVDGCFTVGGVKSMYSSRNHHPGFYTHTWSKLVPSKVNIHCWRAEFDRVPTLVALARRHVPVGSVTCNLCGTDDESGDHLFIGCVVAQQIWNHIESWCNTPPLYAFNFRDILELHKYSGLIGFKKLAFHAIVLVSCWCLWKMRNDVKFNAREIHVGNIIGDIKSLSFLWIRSRSKRYDISWDRWSTFDVS